MSVNRNDLRGLLPFLILALAAVGTADPVRAETRVGGLLKGEHQWVKEGSPYIVTGDVIVPKGSTLYIGPGVTVRFKKDIPSREGLNIADLELLIRGHLVIEGADRDTVYLTSDSSNPQWTDWAGIILDGPDARAELDAVVVEHANEGIRVNQKAHLTARNTTVRNCNWKGIYFIASTGELDNVLLTQVGNEGGTGIGINMDRGAKVQITNSFIVGVQNGLAYARGSGGTVTGTVVSNCIARGVVVRKSNPEFTYCTITQNDFGFVISGDANPKIHQNNIFDNLTLDVAFHEYHKEMRVDLSSNWWGETFPGLIEERIKDGLDDTRVKAFAVIEPVLTEAAGPPAAGKDK